MSVRKYVASPLEDGEWRIEDSGLMPSFPFSILYPPSSLLFSCQPFAKSSGVRTRRSTR